MITQIPDWQTLSDAEILAHLQETEWVPRGRGATLTEVQAAAGEHAMLVDLTLHRIKNPVITEEMTPEQVAELQVMAERMQQACSTMVQPTGLDLSPPARQAMVDMLAAAGQWPDSVRDAVKALGGVYRPRWQAYGYESEPTLLSVQAEIDAENLATLRNNLQARFDAIKNQVGTIEQADAVVSLRAIADELDGE